MTISSMSENETLEGAFNSEAGYVQEHEQIFAKTWFFLGHESQVADRKEFFTTYIGEEPVIVARDGSGELHAFLNTCRHRGMRVCRVDKGHTAAFTCTYHAWTFDTTGALIGVPSFKSYYGDLNKAEWGLLTVSRVETYEGLIFGTFNADAPPLTDFLGGMKWYLDGFLKKPVEVLGSSQRWLDHKNWKLVANNNGSEVVRFFQEQAAADGAITQTNVIAEPGMTVCVFEVKTTNGRRSRVRADLSIESETFPAAADDSRASILAQVGTIYPNFGFISLAGGPTVLRIYHPRGLEETEVWSYCLLDRDVPETKRREDENLYRQMFGAFNVLGSYDAEYWMPGSNLDATQNRSGASSESLPGVVAADKDAAHGSFYARWATDMNFGRAAMTGGIVSE